ncbi:MAG: hypothetical protein GQ555_00205 [Desulfobacterales bacterium]|nr:hypothetical protein [Desulfobacterales bacterium]
MRNTKTNSLTSAEELEYLKTIYGENQAEKLFALLTDSFNVIQNRAQMLLSLITITLTITGFSGAKIAESSLFARLSIAFGLGFVLLSALILMAGPLRLNWCTRSRSKSLDQSLIKLIEQRNFRTERYHQASVALVIGLIGYVTSVISFLILG